jgi:hypothetical protein
MGRKNNTASSVQGGGAAKLGRKKLRKREVKDLELDKLASGGGVQLPATGSGSAGVLPSLVKDDRWGEVVAAGADEESAALRTAIVNAAEGGTDLPEFLTAQDRDDRGYQPQERNARKRQQAQEVRDLNASGHGFLTRKLGTELQRVLRCVVCDRQITISTGEWFCEFTEQQVEPGSWEWDHCPCNWCLIRRDVFNSGYGGRGQPRKYCGHGCRLEMRRRKAHGVEQPAELETAVPTPDPEPVTFSLDAVYVLVDGKPSPVEVSPQAWNRAQPRSNPELFRERSEPYRFSLPVHRALLSRQNGGSVGRRRVRAGAEGAGSRYV